ncbi:response regulator [Confluentibacter citreus]|uniref:response regulator n=1 Tax=Confluentibacter citreus TaxID=2007307 RepID=UPI0012FD2EC3|nr:response regulator [Confluentibacter citreus]
MNKHVLLIDDDPIFHVIFTRMINKVYPGLSVSSSLHGKLALEFLNRNYSIENQYIVLLDINMPVYNGWQFLDAIKKKGIIRNNNITIFVVTSSTDLDDIKRAKAYGFVKDTLSKPLSVNSLNSVLQPLVNE